MDDTRREILNNIRRKKRVKRLRQAIIIAIICSILLPTILCVVLFNRINTLEKKINQLAAGKSSSQEQAEKIEKNLYYQAEDYSSSLEESEQNSYNEEEISAAAKQGDIAASDNTAETFAEKSGNKTIDSNYAAGSDVTEKPSGSNTSTKNTGKQITENQGNNKKTDEIKVSEKDRKKYEGKEIYLTFDDGPSSNTSEILDLLAEYQVKATFFVIGKTDEQSKELYRRIVEEGHSIGMHSYSHDYKQIYKSQKAFETDFKQIKKLIYDTTGVMTDLYRFPGGSGNTVSGADMSIFIRFLGKEKVNYYDWNVASGDATGVDYSPEQLSENVLEGIADHTRSIVLLHDTDRKGNTVTSLKTLLSTLTQCDAKLLKLDNTVKPIQQVRSSSSELNNK